MTEGNFAPDLPESFAEQLLRQTISNDVVMAIPTMAGRFAELLMNEHDRFSRLPTVDQGNPLSVIKTAVDAMRSKIGCIRFASDSVRGRDERTVDDVATIVSGYCIRTGLTQSAVDQSLDVIVEIAARIR